MASGGVRVSGGQVQLACRSPALSAVEKLVNQSEAATRIVLTP